MHVHSVCCDSNGPVWWIWRVLSAHCTQCCQVLITQGWAAVSWLGEGADAYDLKTCIRIFCPGYTQFSWVTMWLSRLLFNLWGKVVCLLYNLTDTSSQTPFINASFKGTWLQANLVSCHKKCFPCSAGTAAAAQPTYIRLTCFDCHMRQRHNYHIDNYLEPLREKSLHRDSPESYTKIIALDKKK